MYFWEAKMQMLGKNKITEIKSLHQKKFRTSSKSFIAEGEKIVDELLLSDWEIVMLYTTDKLFEKYKNKTSKLQLVDSHSFYKISSFETPSGVLAIVKQKENRISGVELKNKYTLCLDGVRDPGNMGTLIRIADWFGIENIICSPDTVELYNHKTIQSTMGSFLRVNVIYNPLQDIVNMAKQQGVPVFGAVLSGENIYKQKKEKEALIVMGSESHGISKEILDLITHPITIPSGLLKSESVKSIPTDSLNVAIASAIVLAIMAQQ